MRTNPFGAIYSRINKGTNADKVANLRDAPLLIDVELTNCCNLQCQMCPTGLGICKRAKGFMSGSTFFKIASYCSEHGTGLRLIRWGEPMLHPELFKLIRIAKSLGVKVHMNTNGTLMDHEAVAEVLSSKLDSIKFSFQETDRAGYEQWRQGGDYFQLCGSIKYLFVQRGKRKHPYIQVSTTLSDEDAVAVEAFHKGMAPICDLVTTGKTKDLQSEAEGNCPTCPEVYDKMSINWDGTVSACCRDYDNLLLVGNMSDQSLDQIWNGGKLHRMRKWLALKHHSMFPLCKECVL